MYISLFFAIYSHILKSVDKKRVNCYNFCGVIYMIINYDVQKINKLLLDFYNATGINMDLRKADSSFVNNQSYWESKCYCKEIQSTSKGRKACIYSDECLFKKSRESKKIEILTCHAGLTDISIPLLFNDEIIGYIIFGQIRTDSDFAKNRKYITSLGLDAEKMEKYYYDIDVFDTAKTQSMSNIAEILVKHILLENILKPNFDANIQKAVYYINNNLEKDLSIQNISKNVNISKSVLYRRFHSYFNCTISEYINKKRIEKSVELLTKSDLSIEDIAQTIGYISGSYYSKIFKKEKGISPLKYKKQLKN